MKWMQWSVGVMGMLCAIAVQAQVNNSKLGPSYDCAKAQTALEKQICGDVALSEADLFLSELYQLSLTQDPEHKAQRVAEQKEWVSAVRNKLCPANDFAWNELGNDGYWSTDPMLRCYEMRITQLRRYVNMDDDFIQRWVDRLQKAHGDNQSYTQSLTYAQHVPRRAQDFYNRLAYRHEVIYYGHTCEGGNLYLYYADEKFIRMASSKNYCNEATLPDKFTHLCLIDNQFVPSSNYWDCHAITANTAILAEMERKLVAGLMTKLLISDGAELSDEDSFVWGFTRNEALVLNDPRLYSDQAVVWAYQHKDLIVKSFGRFKQLPIRMLKNLQAALEAIMQTDDWPSKLDSLRDGPIGIAQAFPAFLGGGFENPISNTLYSQEDFYIQIWARLYQNGGFEGASQLLPELIQAFEQQP